MSVAWKIIGAAVLGLALSGGCQKPNEFVSPPPPEVTVAKPLVHPVTDYLEETGVTEAAERAVVRARIQGILKEVYFEPDDTVTAFDPDGTPDNGLLYLIEPDQYEAKVQSADAALLGAKADLKAANAGLVVAEAQISAAAAQVAVAKADFGRLEELLATRSIAQSEYDQGEAKLKTATAAEEGAVAAKVSAEADISKAEAQVAKAEADLRNAKLDLAYTRVVAPISGRVTKTYVTKGNLVENGTELVAIVNNKPIWANFNLNERLLMTIERDERRTEGERPDPTRFKVFMQRLGDTGFPFEGHLDYYDPEVSQGTSTLALRAVFANDDPEKILIPGLFVRVRVPLGEPVDSLLVPEAAIARDMVGPHVMVVGSDNIVKRKNVQLGSKQGDMIVIANGITADDWVVVVGLQRARPDSEVKPQQTTLSPPELGDSTFTEEMLPPEAGAQLNESGAADGNDQ